MNAADAADALAAHRHSTARLLRDLALTLPGARRTEALGHVLAAVFYIDRVCLVAELEVAAAIHAGYGTPGTSAALDRVANAAAGAQLAALTAALTATSGGDG